MEEPRSLGVREEIEGRQSIRAIVSMPIVFSSTSLIWYIISFLLVEWWLRMRKGEECSYWKTFWSWKEPFPITALQISKFLAHQSLALSLLSNREVNTNSGKESSHFPGQSRVQFHGLPQNLSPPPLGLLLDSQERGSHFCSQKALEWVRIEG